MIDVLDDRRASQLYKSRNRNFEKIDVPKNALSCASYERDYAKLCLNEMGSETLRHARFP